MMYARWPLNYLVSTGVIHRATLLAAYPARPGRDPGRRPHPETMAAHLANAGTED
jgi:hypothetical protein